MGIIFQTGQPYTSPIYYPITHPAVIAANGGTYQTVAELTANPRNAPYNLPTLGGLLVNFTQPVKSSLNSTNPTNPTNSAGLTNSSTNNNSQLFNMIQQEINSLQSSLLTGSGNSGSGTSSSSGTTSSPSLSSYIWYIVAGIAAVIVIALMFVVMKQ